MSMNRITTVLFDLGDTLLNFGRFRTLPVFRAGARASYDYLKSLDQPVGSFRVYLWRNLMQLRARRLLSSITRNDFDVVALFQREGARRRFHLTDEQWLEFAWKWYEPLSRIAKVEPDMKDTLESLRAKGLQLGILSNTFVAGDSLDRQLKQAGLLEFFPVRLYSYQFEFRKPDPRIFEAACKEIGAEPENVLFVGDRIDADIIPAMKMGMHAALKDGHHNAGKPTPAGAHRITTIAELPALVEAIDGNVERQERSATA